MRLDSLTSQRVNQDNRPNLIRKLVLGSTFFKRDGLYPTFWESLSHSTLSDMPQQLKDAYTKVAPNTNNLSRMYEKDKKRMLEFEDWKTEDIHSIYAPTLIMIGDKDVGRPEHAVEMFRLLSNAGLSILPGAHGAYIGSSIRNGTQQDP